MDENFREKIYALFKNALKVFYILPMNQNKVVLRSTRGEKYNCNPKYITEYIVKNCPKDFEIVWLFNEPEKYAYLKEKNIRIYKNKSFQAIIHLLTAKFIIYNIAPLSYVPHRKGQGFIREKQERKQHLTDLMSDTDFLISSCQKFTNTSMKKWGMPEEKILPFGMARNDVYFSDFSYMKEKIRKEYHIPSDTGIIMFAPTFRRYHEDAYFGLDYKKVIDACEKRFQKKFLFAYKMHSFTEHNKTDLTDTDAISFNNHEDMQELIGASDIIIADYSSLIWDAALADVPCFIFAPDLEQYLYEIGFYTPIEEWPFPLAHDNEELFENILSYKEETYRQAVKQHLLDMGSFETGTSAKQIVDLMNQLKNK